MELTTLGERGPTISRFGLGTMSLLTSQDRKAAAALVHQAIDRGINLIDTADVYDNGSVEEALAEALRGRRGEVVLATKVGLPMNGDKNRSGGSRRWIIQAVEDSLRRLGTDYIDIYQLHRPDPATPAAETVEAFDRLQRAGKIRYAGSSVFPPELIVEFQWEAERQGAAPFVCEQAPYSILVRGIEAGTLPVCRRFGIGTLVWSPLNRGWPPGKYPRGRFACSQRQSIRPRRRRAETGIRRGAGAARRRGGSQPFPDEPRLDAGASRRVLRTARAAHAGAADAAARG